ncbi:NAD(P)-binding domain-containing protein [Mumia sp. DW29H23]|uniref:NAD(P)-binding domain-containing protein n=1 Tax=Mumia sp. DW29H23 TaxID=3421241 RepID=UPI003D680670
MSTIVVGGGQAGLAVSHELAALGVEHRVLERGRVAQTWRGRWDSFTLVTPNWSLRLPGSAYDGDEPEGHVPRDAIVAFLQDYAERQAGPVEEGTTVASVETGRGARFLLRTDQGDIDADAVVVCTGAYQRPHLPPAATAFPSSVAVLDVTAYRRPSDLPDGRVLVVGSGQTGVQLAEELHLAGRDVLLACGRAPWTPRRLDGVDVVTWLERAGYFDQPRSALPGPAARLLANPQATGARGGHDLHYRVLQELGVVLTGRLLGVADGTVAFADDLAESVAFGDARLADMRGLLDGRFGDEAPDVPEPKPFVADPPLRADVAGIGAVVLTAGFRPDYARWVQFPVFDADGFPLVADDLSTAVPGLYFCGVHFLRNRRSSLQWGVGDDAHVVARTLAEEQSAA